MLECKFTHGYESTHCTVYISKGVRGLLLSCVDLAVLLRHSPPNCLCLEIPQEVLTPPPRAHPSACNDFRNFKLVSSMAKLVQVRARDHVTVNEVLAS